MATARHIVKPQIPALGGQFETVEKSSSTLKRHPKMELSKPELLQLLGVLEGELQAKEIVIAVLKAEKVKQLLYPKSKSSSTCDPWAALQRDCFAAFDPNFDDTAVKNLYTTQYARFEACVKQFKVSQGKVIQQLQEAEQRCEKLLSELENEKQTHAQDTAQGDDVTYLLEKERERLHHENEFERQQNRCMEKEIKVLNDTIEQERQRQKQMIIFLLEERKQLIYRLAEANHKVNKISQILCDEKGKIADMVDGLEEESKKSLQMEAELERQICEFDIEREQFKIDIAELEDRNNSLTLEVERLQEELELLQKQTANSSLNLQTQLGEGVRSAIVTMVSTPLIRAVPTISPTVSPPRGVARGLCPKGGPAPATPAKPPGLIPQAPTKISSVKPTSSAALPPLCSPPLASSGFKVSAKPVNSGSPIPLSSPSATEGVASVVSKIQAISPVPQYVESPLSPPEGDKIIGDLNANSKMRCGTIKASPVPINKPAMAVAPNSLNAKKIPLGRGAPPPIPPNKPVLPPQGLHRKDTAVSKPPVPPRSDVVPDNAVEDKRPVKFATSNNDESPDGITPEKDEIQVGETSNNTTGCNNVGSEVLVQELADFQKILISMVNNKSPNAVNNSN